jgi:hypothetical protein
MIMSDAGNCIVGTLVRTEFMNGVTHFGDHPGYTAFLEKHGIADQDATYGFNLPTAKDAGNVACGEVGGEGDSWSALMEAWRYEIQSRVTPESVALAIAALERKRIDLVKNPVVREEADDDFDVSEHAEVQRAQARLDAAETAQSDAESASADAESAYDEAKEAFDEAKREEREADELVSTREEELEEAQRSAREEHENAQDEKGLTFAQRVSNHRQALVDVDEGVERLTRWLDEQKRLATLGFTGLIPQG